MSSNAVVSMLRSQFQMGHEWLEGTMQGLTKEQLHWLPEGRAGSMAAEYAHTLMGEDVFVAVGAGGAPLLMGSHADKTGVSAPPPVGDWGEWGRSVRVDQTAIAAYAQGVYAATDAHLAKLTDDDLAREIDLTEYGFGKMALGGLLGLMAAHVFMHMGEISNMKGSLGLKGYPF